MAQASEHTENMTIAAPDTPVELSDSAAKRIAAILTKEAEMSALRISVEGADAPVFPINMN